MVACRSPKSRGACSSQAIPALYCDEYQPKELKMCLLYE
jgi:hypothetical protein